MEYIIIYNFKSNVLETPFSMYAYMNEETMYMQHRCPFNNNNKNKNIALEVMASMQTCPLLMKGL